MRLRYQFELLRAIRLFFEKRGFTDVMTPPMVENPGMETHIHPFEVYKRINNKSQNLFLHTSPEFMMKELLASNEELHKIFTLTYTFRDEPDSVEHRNQFILLEWYRRDEHYKKIMDDTEELIYFTYEYLKEKTPVAKNDFNTKIKRLSVSELFHEVLKVDILNFLDTNSLFELIKKDFKDVPLPSKKLSFDDYYFLLFLNKVEPKLKEMGNILLYEFPSPLSALSTIKKEDNRVCERFELYMNGSEICNAFNEETNLEILKERFKKQNEEKIKDYGYSLPTPNRFYKVMEKYPKSAGIALGVERLLMGLTNLKNPFWS